MDRHTQREREREKEEEGLTIRRDSSPIEMFGATMARKLRLLEEYDT